MTPERILGPALRHAHKDPLDRLLAGASAAGVQFRISGATLQVDGMGGLHPDDQVLLERYLPDIHARLEPGAPQDDLLELLDVDVEVVTDAARAREVIAGLGPGALGFDIETTPRAAGNGTERPWIKLTKSGRPYKNQGPEDRTGLDALRAEPRLAQIYDPTVETVYVVDLRHVPIDVLHGLARRRLAIHNACFEHTMLAAHGIRLRDTLCTMQMAQLVIGAERGGVGLADVARAYLGLEVSKSEQVSDWAADRLSASQLAYAAADAVLAWRVVRPLWEALPPPARKAFRIANATLPMVANMRLAGLPFDCAVHRETIAGWERDYGAARSRFVELTKHDVPPQGRQRTAWLEARLPASMHWYPRTPTGQVSLRRADLEKLAAVPEIRPLLDVLYLDKRLSSFGRTLLERVGADGRLHMDLKPAWTKTGRCSCSDPNVQQLPQDVRRAIIAPPGRTLVIADYAQAELRIAAELSGDEAMRQVFRDGRDMHRLNAEGFIGRSLDDLPPTEQGIIRSKAKRVGFGTLYGSGPPGLVASAWAMYRIEMSEAEAQAYKDAFYARYPRLRQWQSETAARARNSGVLLSVAGRPLRAAREGGALRWTQCCNFPIQSSAADAMLLAMGRLHAALEGIDAVPLLQIHDELVIETTPDAAPTVAALLAEHMTAAWLELFPGAPVIGLVDVATRPGWAKPPKE